MTSCVMGARRLSLWSLSLLALSMLASPRRVCSFVTPSLAPFRRPTPNHQICRRGTLPPRIPSPLSTSPSISQSEQAKMRPSRRRKIRQAIRKTWKQSKADFRRERQAAAKALRHIAAFLWPRRNNRIKAVVMLSLAFLFLSKFISVKTPFFLQQAVDRLNDPTLATLAAPTALLVSYGLSRTLAVLCQELKSVIFSYVSQAALKQYALTIFGKLHSLDSSFHQKNPTGLLSVAYVRGIRGFQTVLFQFVFSVAPTLLEVGLVASILSRRCGGFFLVATMATFFFYALFTAIITEWRVNLRRVMVEVDNERNAYFIDSMSNHEVVKLHANEPHELARFNDYLSKIQATALANTQSLAWLNLGQSIVFSTGLTAMMLMSAYLVANKGMSVGDLVAINGLLLQLAIPFNFLGYTYQELRQAFVDMDYVINVLGMKPMIDTSTEEVRADVKPPPGGARGAVELDQVYFQYPNATTWQLDNVSFSIPAGSTVALVGLSGSGKSTVLKLLNRFFNPCEGSVRIDGRDVRTIPIRELRQLVGVIPQDSGLFDETIEYNIRYGRMDASFEEVVEAAQKARIHEGILAMEDKYTTRVGEKGAKLSGGERQRVSIARSLLRDPAILVCDEVTSALDAFTEKEILESLQEATRNKTKILVAHRLSSCKDADLIVVMQKGKVMEKGTHGSLMANPNGVYSRMWSLQAQGIYEGEQEALEALALEDEHANYQAWIESLEVCPENGLVSKFTGEAVEEKEGEEEDEDALTLV